MLPLTVRADRSALAPAGRVSSTAPLTVRAEIDFTWARLTNAALTAPFTLDSSALPASPTALKAPFTVAALTWPRTPSISIEPFTFEMSSSRADWGTVSVYSTEPERLLLQPHQPLDSGCLVLTASRSGLDSTSTFRSSRSFLFLALFTASSLTSGRSQTLSRTLPLTFARLSRPSPASG